MKRKLYDGTVVIERVSKNELRVTVLSPEGTVLYEFEPKTIYEGDTLTLKGVTVEVTVEFIPK